jgi:hypothetical protein
MFSSFNFKIKKPDEDIEHAKTFLREHEIKISKQPFKYVEGRVKGSSVIVFYVLIYRQYRENTKNINNKIKPIELEFTTSIRNTEKRFWLDDYSILAGIIKYDPGSHGNFCSDFDYDVDSIRGLNVYEAVKKQWEDVKRFFTAEELDLLREIQ